MDDITNLNSPAVVNDLVQAAASLGFTMSSDRLTGSLLRTLAASKPVGSFLELGTGVGMGAVSHEIELVRGGSCSGQTLADGAIH